METAESTALVPVADGDLSIWPPAPPLLDCLDLPPALDGSRGENRAPAGTNRQIHADHDVAAIRAWLQGYANANTFESYRKEAERFLLWAVFQRRLPLSSLRYEDCTAYQKFLSNPQPAAWWISEKKFARGHPQWRPFGGPLQPSSIRQAMRIVNNLLSWLVAAQYLAGNPLALRRGREKKAPKVKRYLPDNLWQELKAHIERLPRDTPRELEKVLRARWVFTLLYVGGLRISEIANNTMGGLEYRRGEDGEDIWVLNIRGKGDKDREVTATEELRTEMARYRRERGLAPMPVFGESTPLVMALERQNRPMTRAGLHLLVTGILKGAADALAARGGSDVMLANQLRQASTHWLRHTAGSAMLDHGVTLVQARDHLGHESIATTNQYVHTEDNARHVEVEEKHKIDWDNGSN